jgi:hypothetical protein
MDDQIQTNANKNPKLVKKKQLPAKNKIFWIYLDVLL